MRTAFTDLVGCSVPIQQAPMGPVASSELAIAVAKAGGVGTITALGMSAVELAARLDDMSARTNGVLSANFLTEDIDEQAVAAAAERVRLIDFFWVTPRATLVDGVHRAGGLVGWQVGSLEEARAAVDSGCDLVTVQGTEAGGHVRGYQPLLPLLCDVLDHIDVPVLAAGGIAHARAVAAMLAAGAAGVRVGTRFIATLESGAHPAYKQAVVDAGIDATVISDAFAICPLCATRPRVQVLRSAAERVAQFAGQSVGEAPMKGVPTALPAGVGLPPFAGVTGHVDAMALYAGQAVNLVNGIQAAADVIAELMSFAERQAQER